MKFIKYLFVIAIAFNLSSVFAQTATVRGFVYDEKTGEPVIFNNVFLKGTTMGAATDVNGYYSITKIPVGSYKLMTYALGSDTIIIDITLKAGQIFTQKLFMKESAVKLKVVNISAARQEAQTEVKMSVTKITPKEIESLPTVGGEADIAQYLQVVPGVIFTGDQGGQLYIRGGSPIQNKILLDGMTIYNPFHSIGLFSVFDTDILRNTEVYTGGFSAEYGGRISSIMDITTRDGNKKRLAGKVAASTFGAKVLLEGPLMKAKEIGGSTASFILSGKTSYLDKTSKKLYTYDNNITDSIGLPFKYTDLYGKISFNGSNGSKFNVFGFDYTDKVNYQAISDLNWFNRGGGMNFLLVPAASTVLIEGNFSMSKYKITLAEESLPARTSAISGFNGGLDFTYYNGDNELKYGVNMSGNSTDFSFFNEANANISLVQNTTTAAAYMKYKINFKKLVIEPSFRLQYYASLSTASPEPRLGAKYNLNNNLRFKLAAGMYSQNLMSAKSDRDIVNLFNGYLSSPDNLPSTRVDQNGKIKKVTNKLQKANHLIVGVEYDLSNRITVNVEGYYKDFRQLTNINRNKIFDENDLTAPEIQRTDFIVETGSAKGIDFLVKYNYKKLNFFVVYSLGEVRRWDGFTNVNGDNGIKGYHPVFDRRHNINLVTSYTFGEDLDWEVSARWNFGSGFPFSQTQANFGKTTFNTIDANYQTSNPNLDLTLAPLNQGRLPSYHRLDLSIKRTFILTENSTLQANFGVTNTYSRKNIFFFDRAKNRRVNQLPIMPSVSLALTF